MEKNALKCYEHVLRIGDYRYSKRQFSWSREQGEKRGRLEMNWERHVKRLMKQKNLTPDDAENRKIWRKATEK
jgi:hypothetical protein